MVMSGVINGLLVPDEIVINKIYHIRGIKVILQAASAQGAIDWQPKIKNLSIGSEPEFSASGKIDGFSIAKESTCYLNIYTI
jgi:NAD-dependent DNA ligase